MDQGGAPPTARAAARQLARALTRALARGGRWGWRLTRPPLVLLVVLATVPSLAAPRFRFPPPVSFAGPAWLNPYAGIGEESRTAVWRTVNLHAHSAAWGGFTHGTGTPDEVRGAYRRRGYDAIAVSNYHRVDTAPGAHSLAVYEHGMNVPKAHVLVIGARDVRWLDFPLVQSVHHQQRVLDHLQGAGALLALPHPGVRGARSAQALQALTGYQLMEVTSKYGTWEREWDLALGAGRLVWALGGDDAHNVRDSTQVGESWTSVASASAAPESLLAALAAGRHVAVSGHRGRTALRLRRMAMRTGVLAVQVDGPVTELLFVGAGGRVRHRAGGGTATYRPAPDDAYVRVVARGDSTVLYFNPVVRHRGHGVAPLTATVDTSATVALRATGGGAALLLLPRLRLGMLAVARGLLAGKAPVPTPPGARPPATPPGERGGNRPTQGMRRLAAWVRARGRRRPNPAPPRV